MIGIELGPERSRLATITGAGPEVIADGPAALRENRTPYPIAIGSPGFCVNWWARAITRFDVEGKAAVAAVPTWSAATPPTSTATTASISKGSAL